MNFELGQIKKITVVTVNFEQEAVSYSYEMIGLKKGELEFIKSEKRITDISVLIKEIKNKYPIVLHFVGKGVLNRSTKLSENYRHTILMNVNLNDFYFTDYIQDNEVFTSIIRKDAVEEQLQYFQEKQLHVIQISSGPFLIKPIVSYLNKSTFNLNGMELQFGDNQTLESFKKVEAEVHNVSLGNYLITSDRLLGIAAGAIFFSPSENLVLPESEESLFEKNTEEAKQRNIFHRFGISAIILFLIITLANQFYVRLLNDDIAENYVKLSEYEESLGMMGELEEESNRKENLLRSSGLLNKSFLSFYIAELGYDIPKEMRFDYLNIRPLKDEIKAKHRIDFHDQLIFIGGQSENSNVLSLWIERIKEKKWIKSVEIMNYTYEKEIGNFELEIVLA